MKSVTPPFACAGIVPSSTSMSYGVWPATLRFLAKSKIDLGRLVTKTFPVDDALIALEESQKPAENIKVHLQFNASL